MSAHKQTIFAVMTLIMGLSSAHAMGDRHEGRRPGSGIEGRLENNYPGYPGYGSHLSQNAPEIVRRLYRGMLFREPDAGGFRNAVALIQSRGERGLADLAVSIGNSPEYHQNIEPRYRNRKIVKNLYRELLNREGEPAGVRFWEDALDRGASGDVLKGFVTSEEFRQIWIY